MKTDNSPDSGPAGPAGAKRQSLLRRIVVATLRLIVIAYATLFAFAWFFGEGKIFLPQPSSYTDSNEIIKLTAADGVKISAIFLPRDGAKYTVLYSHGNAADMGDERPSMEHLRGLGLAVLGYDYHGYGTSGGKPSEHNCYLDIDAAYEYLTGTLKIPPGRIILYGRSVGGGPAVDLAARKPVAGLILENAFTSAFRVVTRVRVLPFDHFNNIGKIGKVHCPVLVIHGRGDEVIPFRQGPELFEAANEPKQCLWVDGAGHNNIMFQAGEEFDEAIRLFVQLVGGRVH